MLHDFGQKFVILWGWRRLVAAFGFGLLAAAAMQPLLLWPVLFLSMPVLVWLLDGVAAEQAGRMRTFLAGFAVGWAFGFGYFLASLYWIGAAFLVEAHLFAWMMPLAVAGIAAGMAVYWGLASGLACLVWRGGLSRIFLLAALLAGAEWLRGHLFSGFPWNSLGYAAEAFDGLSQNAAHIGMWGLSFFVALWTLAPARLAAPATAPANFLLLVIAGSALGLWAAGSWRLAQATTGYVPDVGLRIVQPNMSQSEKWRTENAAAILQTLLAMSDAKVEPYRAGLLTHVIWPESSVPILIDERADALHAIGSVLPDGATLVDGVASARSPNRGSGRRTHRIQQSHGYQWHGPGGRHLRQGASRSVRRIPAPCEMARASRSSASGDRSGELCRGIGKERNRSRRGGAGVAADLL